MQEEKEQTRRKMIEKIKMKMEEEDRREKKRKK